MITTDQIDDYLMGQLSPEEKAVMETAIVADPVIAARVEKQKALIGIVEGYGDTAFATEVRAVHQAEMEQRKKQRSSKRRWLYSIAVASVVVLGCLIWLWSTTSTTKQLYAQYYAPYALNFTARNLSDQNQLLTQAATDYQAGNYAQALTNFEVYYANDDSDSKVLLAISVCQLETGAESTALQNFETIADQDFDRYKDHAHWYMGLIYLRRGKTERAISLFDLLISNNRPPFYQKAKEIRSQL